MKDNGLTLKDENGNKHEYRILLTVEDTNEKKNYVLYTDENKNKNGDVICYASSYVLSKKGNITKLKPVTENEEFDFLSKVLGSLESE